jgi:S1-C subfamily serine protease
LKWQPTWVRTNAVPMMSRQQLAEMARAVRGVPVLGCLPGSTAAEAGVRYGDIVTAVNGVETPTMVEYLEARKLREDGFELRIFRAGVELTLFVPFRTDSEPPATLALKVAEGRYLAADERPAEPSGRLPS